MYRYVYAYQNVECEPGKKYRISCDMENDPTSLEVGIHAVYGNNSTENNVGINIYSEGEQSISFEYTALADSLIQQSSFKLELRVYKRIGSYFCQGYFNNVEVKPK